MFKNLFINGLILILILLLFIIPSFASIIRFGDSSIEVREVQQLLYDLGYDIAVDRDFGYETLNIVKDFQKSNGLRVDGLVGEQTLSLLRELNKDTKYTVRAGDSLSNIARKYNSTVNIIKERNNLNSDLIRIGQILVIPKTGIGGGEEERLYSTIHHKVKRGDVLSIIARRYGVDINTIKLYNNLSSDRIYVGQTIKIPRSRSGENQPFQLTKGSIIWPVLGRISSPYGPRTHPITGLPDFHGGIDIAVPTGTEIRAVAEGTVVQSGWVNGFGKTVIIDHGGGIRTLYAHNSRLLVHVGNKVDLGQVIALSGSTGQVTGPHLDFRIYVDGKTVNPMNYLL